MLASDESLDSYITTLHPSPSHCYSAARTVDLDIDLIENSTRDFLLSEQDYQHPLPKPELITCPEIKLLIGGVTINALIDTGSKITCVSGETYDKFSEAWKHFPTLPLVGVQAIGFTGEKSVNLKRQFRAPIEIKNLRSEYNFLIVPKLVRECILGIDFQESFQAVIDVKRHQVTLNNALGDNYVECPFNYEKLESDDRKELISFLDSLSCTLSIEADCDSANVYRNTNIVELTDTEIFEKIHGIENISEYEKSTLIKLIRRFRTIFRKAPGQFLSYEYAFKVIDESPCFRKSHPVAIQMRDILRKEIQRMLQLKIIERSDTNHINPLVPVFKKDDTVRVCLGAVDLNERIESDHEGPVDMEQIFRKCKRFGIMSSIDLTASYWQVPLALESRHYTGFMFEGRTYHFCVVPFGTKVSCAALSRAAESTLKGLEDFLIDFADDWLCVLDDFAQHIDHLELLFERILVEGITVNFSKVKFCRQEIKFLGYILTTEGIKPDPDKIQGIREFPTPRNPKQLRGFLGVLNFSSRFTSHLSQEIQPLLRLLKKGVKWKWEKEDTVVFEKVKKLFSDEVLLYHPDKSRPFILCTDSSHFGLGALLYQTDDEGKRVLVCCASRGLRGSEVNYFTTELELLAIVWSLSKFRTFLVKSEVVIETDHKALTFLLSTRFINDRLTRWILAIQDYAPKIVHVPGSQNIAADVLSRLSGHRSHKLDNDALIGMIYLQKPSRSLQKVLKNINHFQINDPKLKLIMNNLKTDKPVRDYSLHNDILFKGTVNKKCIVLTEEIINNLVLETHQLYGHLGVLKCVKMISENFYYPNLKAKTTRILRGCDSCQRNKIYTSSTAGRSSPIVPDGPHDLISIDFCGPLPTSRGGTKYILAVLDVFTKFVVLYAIRRADTRTTINKIFNNYIPLYGKPKKVQSDHGTQFTSKGWVNRLESEGIRAVFSSIRHPQSNAVERINKEIGRYFRTLTSDKHT